MSDHLPLDAYWMPYTGNRQFKRDPRIIVEAKDVWFTDDRGRRILDGHSGLWTSGLVTGIPKSQKPSLTRSISWISPRLFSLVIPQLSGWPISCGSSCRVI